MSTGSSASSSELTRRLALGALAALLVVGVLAPADGLPKEGMSVMLGAGSLALLAGWLLAAFFASGGKRGDTKSISIVFGRPEILLTAFLLLVAASALFMAREGNPRATNNAFWQWITCGVVFFLARQLIGSAGERRAIAVVMLGLTSGLACYGGHQYFVELPATRAEYRQDPAKARRLAGVDAAPNSPLAKQFEDRVLGSVEPIGTFALANSFAGVLAPWLMIASGIAFDALARRFARRSSRGDLITLIAAGCCSLAIGACLLLTKSRSAWLGALAGAMVLGIYAARLLELSGKKTALALGAAALVAVVGVGAAIGVGALDVEVLKEAPKSLSYRLEYWQAALAMSRDWPLFGCGPGNFQEFYALYKPPEASETVGDPHQFLLEILATCGSVAAIAFVGFSSVVALRLWQSRDSLSTDLAKPSQVSSQQAPWPVVGGAIFGIALAAFHNLLLGNGLSIASLTYCALGIVAAWVGMREWIHNGRLLVGALVAALVALMVNLTAAGGVSFPNVAIGGWLLAALAVSQGDAANVERRALPRAMAAVAALASLALLGTMVLTAYRPVLEAKAFLQRAEQTPSPEERQKLLALAASADPYNPEPYRLLAAHHARRFEATGEQRERQAFQKALGELFARDTRSHAARRMAGDLYLNLWRRSDDGADLTAAVESYRQAVELYPASGFLHAQLALALDLAGERESAASEAGEALRLDSLNRHQELDLSKAYLHDGLPHDNGGAPGVLAEPWLLKLRTTR